MSASPSFMKNVFVYAKEDNHLALRQAAARGDINKIKTLFQNREIDDINSKGAGTGRTALHQAALHGKKEAVKLLISLGADPTLLDNNPGKSPRVLALDKGHDVIAQLLQQAEHAYDSIKAAKTAFYMSIDECPMGVELFQDFIAKASEIYTADHKRLTESRGALDEPMKLFFPQLIEIKAYLEASKDRDYHIGKCGELTRACLASLLAIEPKLPITKLQYYDKDQPRRNHTFIAINLEMNNTIDVNTWSEDVLICDPAVKEGARLYFLKYAPKISAINEMKRVDTIELQFFSNKIIIDTLNFINPVLGREASRLIEHNHNLLSELQSRRKPSLALK